MTPPSPMAEPRDWVRLLRKELWAFGLLSVLPLVLLIVAGVSDLPIGPHGDGVGYFSYLRSFFFDGDLNFQNEYTFFAARGERTASAYLESERTEIGLPRNHWPVGAPVLWSPFYLAGHIAARMLYAAGVEAARPDGYTFPYVLGVGLANALYGFAGLMLSYAFARQFYSRGVCTIAFILLWLATSLTEYLYVHTTLAHPTSMLLVALYFLLWSRWRPFPSPARSLVLGVVIGAMVAGRWQSLLFVLPLAYEMSEAGVHALARGARDRLVGLGCGSLGLAAGALAGFVPQLVAWQLIYGHFFSNPWAIRQPWTWTSPKILSVLLSSDHGLISWTPVVALALLGLICFVRQHRRIGLALWAGFLTQLYLVASFYAWDGGSSFGNRYFIECTPIFLVGLAGFLDWARRRVTLSVTVVAAALLIIWNVLFMIQWSVGLIPREGLIPWGRILWNQFVGVPVWLWRAAFPYLLARPNLALSIAVVVILIVTCGIWRLDRVRVEVRGLWRSLATDWASGGKPAHSATA